MIVFLLQTAVFGTPTLVHEWQGKQLPLRGFDSPNLPWSAPFGIPGCEILWGKNDARVSNQQPIQVLCGPNRNECVLAYDQHSTTLKLELLAGTPIKGCPKGPDSLKLLEQFSKLNGFTHMKLEDASRLNLFNLPGNRMNDPTNPMVRTTLLNFLIGGTPTSLYEKYGFSWSESSTIVALQAAGKELDKVVIEDIKVSERNPVMAILKGMDQSEKIVDLFKRLHASGIGGNKEDQETLAKITNAILFMNPYGRKNDVCAGVEELNKYRMMKKTL